MVNTTCTFLCPGSDCFCVNLKVKKGDEKQHQRGQERKQGKVFDDAVGGGGARHRRDPKAVDEDLYKIPPELLYKKPKRVIALDLLSVFLPKSIVIKEISAWACLSAEEVAEELVVRMHGIALHCMRRMLWRSRASVWSLLR